MNSQDNAQAGLFDWGTPAWMQPDPEPADATDRAGLDVDHAVGHIVSKGFTERQARFLVLVARHSGVCVMRQYAAFGGVVFGHTTRRFFAKLERLGWVSTYDCARKRARIYHVRHRELYEAIGDPDSRLRRPPTVPRALERLMLLDVVLGEPDLIWLSTPDEKLAHVSVLTSVKSDALPQAASPLGSHEPARYFPDHAPIGIHPQGRWVIVCLLTQDATATWHRWWGWGETPDSRAILSAQKVVPENTRAVIVEVRVLFARELPDAHARVNSPRVQKLVPDLRHDDQGLITGERDVALVEEVIDVRR